MKYIPKQYAEALYLAVSESRPSDRDRILDNFVKILKENGDLSKADEIEREFLEYDRASRGIKQVHVRAARELGLAEERKIIEELNAYIGGKVELKKKVDAGLLGGVILKIDDEQIDGSVKGDLADLKNKLIEGSL